MRYFLIMSVLCLMMNMAWITSVRALDACTGATHTLDLSVYAQGAPANNAEIRYFINPERTILADHLALNGAGDAIIRTDVNGSAMIALAERTYYLRITALGMESYDTIFSMPPDGTCTAQQYTLTPAGAVTTVDYTTSTAVIEPPAIKADDMERATITIQARNQYGSVLRDIPASLENPSFSGLKILAKDSVTTAAGKATFLVTSSEIGTAVLLAKLNQTVIKQLVLTLVPPITSPTTTKRISQTQSHLLVTHSPAKADGVSPITVNVFAKDEQGTAVANQSVIVRCTTDNVRILPTTLLTDANGYATFTITSTSVGQGILTVSVGETAISERTLVAFTTDGFLSPTVRESNALAGTLIKLADDQNPITQEDTAVYYVGNDGKRHPFLDERTYFTWYADFAPVKTVASGTLAALQIGRPVTYRPGTKLLKLPSVPNVYALFGPRILRWIPSASLAQTLFGPRWESLLVDVPESYFSLFSTGADMLEPRDFQRTAEQSSAWTIEHVL